MTEVVEAAKLQQIINKIETIVRADNSICQTSIIKLGFSLPIEHTHSVQFQGHLFPLCTD